MDLIVRQIADATWLIIDLLDRRAGSIEQAVDSTFKITPAGGAIETMNGMPLGPYHSLDAALAAIETQTRGTCRIEEARGDPDDALPAKPATADVIEMPIREGDA